MDPDPQGHCAPTTFTDDAIKEEKIECLHVAFEELAEVEETGWIFKKRS